MRPASALEDLPDDVVDAVVAALDGDTLLAFRRTGRAPRDAVRRRCDALAPRAYALLRAMRMPVETMADHRLQRVRLLYAVSNRRDSATYMQWYAGHRLRYRCARCQAPVLELGGCHTCASWYALGWHVALHAWSWPAALAAQSEERPEDAVPEPAPEDPAPEPEPEPVPSAVSESLESE
jgi:hypothetical protein